MILLLANSVVSFEFFILGMSRNNAEQEFQFMIHMGFPSSFDRAGIPRHPEMYFLRYLANSYLRWRNGILMMEKKKMLACSVLVDWS